MGNAQTRNYATWYNGNDNSPIHTQYGAAQGPLNLVYGATMPTTLGTAVPEGNWKLIGAAQNLAYKNNLYYLYGKMEIPNRKYSYFITSKENGERIPLQQNYKLKGNEIVFPKGYNAYLENEFRTIVKSENWDAEK